MQVVSTERVDESLRKQSGGPGILETGEVQTTPTPTHRRQHPSRGPRPLTSCPPFPTARTPPTQDTRHTRARTFYSWTLQGVGYPRDHARTPPTQAPLSLEAPSSPARPVPPESISISLPPHCTFTAFQADGRRVTRWEPGICGLRRLLPRRTARERR